MKTQFLFPNKMKPIGWLLFIPSLIFGIVNIYNKSDSNGFSYFELAQSYNDEIAIVGILLGLTIIGFSKLKIEDEYVQKIMLESLLWATYVNIGFIISCTLFFYYSSFEKVLIYNLFTLPLFFVIRFHLFLARR